MYKGIQNKLRSLIDKDMIAVIDEGRSRKKKERCKIRGVYNRIFTIELDNKLLSFSYSDLICKTITLNIV